MFTLNKKLSDVYERHVPESGPGAERDLREGSALLVPAEDRRSGKRRYLGYRCRQLVRERLSVDDRGDLDLDEGRAAEIDLSSEIDLLASEIVLQFGAIEDFYKQMLNRESGRLDLTEDGEIHKAIVMRPGKYRHAALRMWPPRKIRRLMIWDIVWGILAVHKDLARANEEHRDSIVETIERRLRKIERMRYHVSRDAVTDTTSVSDRRLTGPANDRRDGHLLRMFEYPEHGYPERVGGAAKGYWDHERDSSGDPTDLQEFVLIPPNGQPNGVEDPLAAIQGIFTPADTSRGWRSIEDRTVNYCDKVIHTLHLEDLAQHLIRKTGTAAASQTLETLASSGWPKRLSIVTSRTTPGAIGSGRNDDAYFELLEGRIDELIPGDHIYLRSHPAYHGVSRGAFRLENSLVTRILGTKLPRDVEVQGHGLGPYRFAVLQRELVEGFIHELDEAQKKISSQVLSDANTNQTNGIPYRYDADVDPDFEGVIEFRNELSPLGKGAFWARWLFNKGWPQSEEFKNDNRTPPDAWEMPFVEDADLDASQRMLTLRGSSLTRERVAGVYFVSDTDRYYSQDTGWVAPGSLLVKHSGVALTQADLRFLSSAELQIPIPVGWNPPSDYWKVVLQTGTRIKIEIRCETSFRWPDDGQQQIKPRPAYSVAYFPLFEGSKPTKVDVVDTSAALLKWYEEHRPEHTIPVIRPRLRDLIGNE